MVWGSDCKTITSVNDIGLPFMMCRLSAFGIYSEVRWFEEEIVWQHSVNLASKRRGGYLSSSNAGNLRSRWQQRENIRNKSEYTALFRNTRLPLSAHSEFIFSLLSSASQITSIRAWKITSPTLWCQNFMLWRGTHRIWIRVDEPEFEKPWIWTKNSVVIIYLCSLTCIRGVALDGVVLDKPAFANLHSTKVWESPF